MIFASQIKMTENQSSLVLNHFHQSFDKRNVEECFCQKCFKLKDGAIIQKGTKLTLGILTFLW